MEGWLEGEIEVYRFVTKPDLDKFVPKRLQKHFKEGGLQYTDIIRYDPAKISQSPFVLDVTSIPPILAERVLPFTTTSKLFDTWSCQKCLHASKAVVVILPDLLNASTASSSPCMTVGTASACTWLQSSKSWEPFAAGTQAWHASACSAS